MANILVVTGSARPNSVNSKVVPEVVNIINSKNHNAVVVFGQHIGHFTQVWEQAFPKAAVFMQ